MLNQPNRSFEESVCGCAGPVLTKCIHMSHADRFDRSSVQNGILFYHAPWSGPSMMALTVLFARLAELGSALPIYVFNADDYSKPTTVEFQKLQELFGPSIGGFGETGWIHNGVIRHATLGRGNSRELLEEILKEMFTQESP
jgi:hypothetical protein